MAGKASRVYHLTLYRKKCWPLAFIHRFLVVFLLSLENGELLLAVRGRGMMNFGTFLLKLSPFGVCGLAESASEGHSVYEVVLEIQNPFLLYRPASAPSAAPPSPRLLMSVLVPRPWGLYCPVVSPHSAPVYVNSPFRKWSSSCLFVCNIYFLLGP